MKFKQIARTCHVRSSIYRKGKPDKKYAKNHTLSFEKRIPLFDRLRTDWVEYDPNDDYGFYGAESY